MPSYSARNKSSGRCFWGIPRFRCVAACKSFPSGKTLAQGAIHSPRAGEIQRGPRRNRVPAGRCPPAAQEKAIAEAKALAEE